LVVAAQAFLEEAKALIECPPATPKEQRLA